MTLLGISGLFAAWALILCFIGGVKLVQPGGPEAQASASILLGCAGVAALASLGFWIGVISRGASRGIVWKIIQLAAGLIALGSIATGLLGHATRRDGLIFVVSVVTIFVCWIVRRLGRRPLRDRTRTHVSR